MASCIYPIKGWRSFEGTVTTTFRQGFCDLPAEVPCGKCVACLLEKSRQWAVRCVHEAQMHPANCMVTLTYNDEHLPPGGALHPPDFTAFRKALRKRIGPFRYFQCGEYGGKNDRPHHHAIIFGTDFSFDRTEVFTKPGEHPRWRSETLDKSWKRGFATINEFNFETAKYTAQYVLKKIRDPDHIHTYVSVDTNTGELESRQSEYITMSRRPGIGSTWYDRYGHDVYPSDQVIIDGRPQKPPLYYDRKLRDEEPEIYDKIRAKRRKHRKSFPPDLAAEKAARTEEFLTYVQRAKSRDRV